MKKHISVYAVSLCCILLFFCLALRRGAALHKQYPDPPIRTYQYGESIRIGSYQMMFGGWQWGDESLVKAKFPDFILVYPQEDGLIEDVRMGLISFTVTKISQDKDILDLTNMGFSSGAWGNQFDLELFHLLNPDLDSPRLNLAAGKMQEIVLPMTMLETQFAPTQWKDIDNRKFYINVQYYPEHIRFLCPHEEGR